VYALITLPFTIFWLGVVAFFALLRPWLRLDFMPAAIEFERLFRDSREYQSYFSHLATLDGNRHWIGEVVVAGEGREAFELVLSLPIVLRWLPPRAVEQGHPDCLVSEGCLEFMDEDGAEGNQFELDPRGQQDLWKGDEWSAAAKFLTERTNRGRDCLEVKDIRDAIEFIDERRRSARPQPEGVGAR
jgi:hypothetical protein